MSNDNKCMTCIYSEDSTVICANCIGFSEYLQRVEPSPEISRDCSITMNYGGSPSSDEANPIWVVWDGGLRPVPIKTLVTVKFRNGDIRTCDAGDVIWYHTGADDDILAYRMMPPNSYSELAEQCNEPFKSVKEKVLRFTQGIGRFHKGGLVTHLPTLPEMDYRALPADAEKAVLHTAHDLLAEAAEIMEERGKQYDQEGGERSMAKTVSAFNIITGHQLSEADGWMFMDVLKSVRLFSVRDETHADSVKDKIAYAALLGECAMRKGRID